MTRGEPITETTLEEAAVHVRYEAEQLILGTYCTTPERLDERGHVRTEDSHVGRAVHEAFLVHARVLNRFLGDTTPKYDDVLAVDFCDRYTAEYPLTEQQAVDLNKRLAHLTLIRTDDFSWGSRWKLTNPIFKQYRAWVSVLVEHEPKRAAWFEDHTLMLRRFLRQSVGGWPQRATG